jgi:hypothetical protein
MMSQKSDIPTAIAIADTAAATTTTTTTITTIPAVTASIVHMIGLNILPHESSYISFVGIPPRVSQILQVPPALQGREAELTGAYFHSLKIACGTLSPVHKDGDDDDKDYDLEISNVTTDQQLRQILLHFQHLPRQIVLSKNHPPLLNEASSCVYKHTLPTNVSLQGSIDFDGFPAKVKAVAAPTSSSNLLHGRMIQPGQYVDGIYVHGHEPLTADVPGFTGYRVQEHLENTKLIPRRILILSDPSPATVRLHEQKKQKGKTPLFDWGGFFK